MNVLPEWYTTADYTGCSVAVTTWAAMYDPPSTAGGVREPRRPRPPQDSAGEALTPPLATDAPPAYRHTI